MLTLDALRTRAANHSLFTTPSIADAVKRLGFVQADPIQAPARAQDLILRHRVEGYRAGDLEQRYPELALDEEVLHVYGFMPSRMVSLVQPRTVSMRIDQEHPRLAASILDFIRSNGHTSHRDLERHFGGARTTGYWGNQAKATTLALDSLHYRGQVRVALRKGNERFYAIATREETTLQADERLRRLVLLLVNLYAPVSKSFLPRLVGFSGRDAPTLEMRRTVVKRMLSDGELLHAKVDGIPYYWPATATFERRTDGEVRFLAPFDPIVYDRERFEHVWGWLYRFEAYTPAAKRKLGYYALPMMWRDRVIGWANVAMRDGRMHIDVGYVAGRRPADRGFNKAFVRESERMEAFLKT